MRIARNMALVLGCFCASAVDLDADTPATQPYLQDAPAAVKLPEFKDRRAENMAQRIYLAAQKQAHHLLQQVRPWEQDADLRLLTKSGSAEGFIRPNTCTVAGLCALYGFGPYDEKVVGCPRAELLERSILPMMRYLSTTHVTGSRPTSDGKRWGDHWQSPLWTHSLAMGAVWIWDELPADMRRQMQLLVEHEAERIVRTEPPYQIKNDTKAEENAWNSRVLAVASILMPTHPRRPVWDDTFQRWVMSAFLRPADAKSQEIVDGKSVVAQFSGANIHDDFTLENHHIVHPDYMTAFSLKLGSALDYATVGRETPQAVFHNNAGIYENLKWFVLPDGGFVYPNGQDWHLFRNVDWMYPHILQAVFGGDPQAWPLAERSLRVLELMQKRSSDGAVFLPEEYFFASTQTDKLFQFVLSWMSLHFVSRTEEQSPQRWGVRRMEEAQIILNRTRTAVHTLSWGSRAMAQCVPYALDRIVSPDGRNGIGSVIHAGKPLPVKCQDARITDTDDGFTAELVVEHGEQVRAVLSYRSQSDGSWHMHEKLTAMKDIEQVTIATGLIGILNNPHWVYEKGKRDISIGDRKWTVASCSGQVIEPDPADAVQIDSVLRISSAAPLRVRYAAAAKSHRARVTDELILNAIPAGNWRAGQLISEWQATITCTPAPASGPGE